eukprot:TRINITY_DN2094_c7_g1_i1.p1 TRINITY_DN2094_c7_g1~~TRINITY_DN2094_c7_g1_i1.p1  ORF type:complete len:106 (-),score=16.24 TRINITY_DN2094_c7_g1_i1:33-350(-)
MIHNNNNDDEDDRKTRMRRRDDDRTTKRTTFDERISNPNTNHPYKADVLKEQRQQAGHDPRAVRDAVSLELRSRTKTLVILYAAGALIISAPKESNKQTNKTSKH